MGSPRAPDGVATRYPKSAFSTILLGGMAASTLGTKARGQMDLHMNEVTKSNWRAGVRTGLLLASLTGILVVVGGLIGGPSTALLFLGIGLVMNLFSYFFSDKIALRMSHAKPLPEDENPRLHQMV